MTLPNSPILGTDKIKNSRVPINENFSHLDNQKEPLITPTTNQDYLRGDKTFQNLANAVVGTLLTGLGAGVNLVISATDSLLTAFSKLQGQINALITSVGTKANDSSVIHTTGNETKTGNLSLTGVFTVNSQIWSGAWSSFTPTVVGDSGAVSTYGVQTGRYKIIGKTVIGYLRIQVTNKGTLSGNVYVPLPVGNNYVTDVPCFSYFGPSGSNYMTASRATAILGGSSFTFQTNIAGSALQWSTVVNNDYIGISFMYETN